jgi:hypothetical protein
LRQLQALRFFARSALFLNLDTLIGKARPLRCHIVCHRWRNRDNHKRCQKNYRKTNHAAIVALLRSRCQTQWDWIK